MFSTLIEHLEIGSFLASSEVTPGHHSIVLVFTIGYVSRIVQGSETLRATVRLWGQMGTRGSCLHERARWCRQAWRGWLGRASA